MEANEAERTVGRECSARMATTARRTWAFYYRTRPRDEPSRSRTFRPHLESQVSEAPNSAAQFAGAQLTNVRKLWSVTSDLEPEKALTTSAGLGCLPKIGLYARRQRRRALERLSGRDSRNRHGRRPLHARVLGNDPACQMKKYPSWEE
jgi:hypothetical protein